MMMRGQGDLCATLLLGPGRYPNRFPMKCLVDVFRAGRHEFPEVTATEIKSLWCICIIYLDCKSYWRQTGYIH